MAKRPIFVPLPSTSNDRYVDEIEIEFEWVPGLAKTQKQKCIRNLHEAARKRGYSPVLEISSKSESRLGIALSAFNLKLKAKNGKELSVECAFQGSKVFERGGPFKDLYDVDSRTAKTDPRLRESGKLVEFRFEDWVFPLKPETAFYDWLYLTALWQNIGQNKERFIEELLKYRAFSDIEFNPNKSLNCQARSAALFVALYHRGEIEKAVSNQKDYLNLIQAESARQKARQGKGKRKKAEQIQLHFEE